MFHDHAFSPYTGQFHLVHLLQLDRMYWLFVWFVFVDVVVVAVSISSFRSCSIVPVRHDVSGILDHMSSILVRVPCLDPLFVVVSMAISLKIV